MSFVKSEQEIAILREGGHKLAAILAEIKTLVRPGASTKELDERAEALIRSAGGEPSFKGYKISKQAMPYPASLCVSVNDEVVHGIPSDRILQEGNIVGLDIGMKYGGLFTDMAETVMVGVGDKAGQKLIEATKEALKIGIAEVHAGAHVGDIGEAVQTFLEIKGFGVVRELVGHGVGHAVHEDPEVPNWGSRGKGIKLEEGMVIAIEPMVTEKSPAIYLAGDGWTWKTKDGARAAHFEHTMAVTKEGAEILTK